MRPRRQFTEQQKREVEEALKVTRNKEEYQRIQVVWLRMTLGLRASEIGKLTGLHPASIWRIHARFFREGSSIFNSNPHGGRYRENLTLSEEKKVLSPFVKSASVSGVLIVSGIKLAYEKALGHQVPKSTVYRMLERHGWRKLAPRPSHPNADPEAQADLKKTLH
jgi:transposase